MGSGKSCINGLRWLQWPLISCNRKPGSVRTTEQAALQKAGSLSWNILKIFSGRNALEEGDQENVSEELPANPSCLELSQLRKRHSLVKMQLPSMERLCFVGFLFAILFYARGNFVCMYICAPSVSSASP